MRNQCKKRQTWPELIESVFKKDIRALSKLITRVENREEGWKEAMSKIYPYTGKTDVIGITGSPGAGKSSLTNEIARQFLAQKKQVGIIAVDPSSPFTGGALLGDRIRMNDLTEMPGIYIRSMATRGQLGGLCQAARDVVRILDAFGKDVIIIETVGVGQDEIDVIKMANLILLVCAPGLGDGIQAIKAGVMEIADIYVVNKADQQGVDQTVYDIRAMLDLSEYEKDYIPAVIKTSAVKNFGIEQLLNAMSERLQAKKQINARRHLIREELISLVEQEVVAHIHACIKEKKILEQTISMVMEDKLDLYSAVFDLINQVFPKN